MRKLVAVPALLGMIIAPSALALPAGPEGRVAKTRDGQPLTPHVEPAPRPKPKAAAVPPHLQAIAACESGGNPKAVDSSGTYYGKYQFSMETWAGVGGSGSPAEASEAEQDRRAVALYERSGPGQWPVCSQ